jgi:deoxyadenosine/deoxycytidine kinase
MSSAAAVSTSPRPRYIAVEGPPGAGVGPLAARLAADLGARLVQDPTSENPFLEGFSRDARRHAFQAQLFFLLARYRQQGELAQGDLFASGGVVADYCFARDRLWARLTLSADELSLYEKVHALLDARVPRPDLVVYVTARPEVLRARLQKRVKPTDRVVEAGLIDEIAASMSRFFFQYDESPLLVVNTSEIDHVDSEATLDDIVAVIRKTRAGVNHYIPGSHR